MFEIAELESPVGPLTLAARRGRLCALMFSRDWDDVAERLSRRLGETAWRTESDPAGAVSAVEAYFGGDVDALTTFPVEMNGTPFQCNVWSAMRDIPAGAVASYGDLAFRIGGAAYLLYLAFMLWRHAGAPIEIATARNVQAGGWQVFLRALLLQLGNPKIMVFFGSIFLSLLPAQSPGE